jgi:carbon monoxide dehydrogenase subunit G
VELTNEFRVAIPAAKTWEFLSDVERVAPCLPGATLLSVDGDEFTGAVKVKVGPITVSYKGEAAFVEKDTAAQRMVLKANGKETRGNGNAAAVVTAQLKDEGDATNVVHHHGPDHLGQGGSVRPRCAIGRGHKPDRSVRQRP